VTSFGAFNVTSLQAMILESYPAKLSLAALMCIMGTVESTILAFAVERANTAVWSVYFDVRLLAAVYGVRNSKLEQNYFENFLCNTCALYYVTPGIKQFLT